MGAGMSQNAHTDFVSQVQTGTVIFQHIHHTEALLIVAERDAHRFCQGYFTGMPEGGMT